MKRKVLVVDDDLAIVEVLEMRLVAMGYEVTATSDAERALNSVESTRFALALIDLRMAPTDGIALMESLHARQPRLPVLIMTAHGTIETAVNAVQRGAFDYLTKPFLRDELRNKINRALASRRWARDRERLLAVGQTLASSGIMARVLDTVAQGAVETTDAERCVVFQQDHGQLVPMASAGSMPPSGPGRGPAAAAAMTKGLPVAFPGSEGAAIVAAPLVVQRGPMGAVVIETAPGVEPNEDDLDLLALFSSQAAVAVRNTFELERLRSGALAALGRMATEVAHELKNPLAGLRLYGRHLETRLGKNGDVEGSSLAQKITSTVDHLASVVQEITAFGRPPELQRVPTSMAALLDECVAFAQAKCDTPGIEVVRAYDPACPVAMLDARELRKAFLNLVLNALGARSTGGRLTGTIGYSADTHMVTVIVEDTGAGMSEETLSRMYDLFFTTKPQGTGLGMALARSVVDLHAGELAINSALGKGTRGSVGRPVEPASSSSGGAHA